MVSPATESGIEGGAPWPCASGELRKLGGQLLARSVHDHARSASPPRRVWSASRAIEALPPCELLRGVAGGGEQDELVPGETEQRARVGAEGRVRLFEGRGADAARVSSRRRAPPSTSSSRRVSCALRFAASCARRRSGVLEREPGVIGQPTREHEGLRLVGRHVVRPDHAQSIRPTSPATTMGIWSAVRVARPARTARSVSTWRLSHPADPRRRSAAIRASDSSSAGHVARGSDRVPGRAIVVGRLLVDEHGFVRRRAPRAGRRSPSKVASASRHTASMTASVALAGEARREPRDPVEALAQRALAVIEPRALERLPSESRGELRQRDEIRRRCCRPTSNGKPIEPTTRSSLRAAGRRARCAAYSASRAPSGNSRSNSSRELANAGGPGARRLGDRRPGIQWHAEAGRQGRAPHAAGIDDHELVVVDEAEGAADGAEERRHALDEGVRHLVGRRSRRELRGQRTKGVSLSSSTSVRTRCC